MDDLRFMVAGDKQIVRFKAESADGPDGKKAWAECLRGLIDDLKKNRQSYRRQMNYKQTLDPDSKPDSKPDSTPIPKLKPTPPTVTPPLPPRDEPGRKAIADAPTHVTLSSSGRSHMVGRFMGVYVKQSKAQHSYPLYVREFKNSEQSLHRYCLYRASYSGKWIVASKESDMASNKGPIASYERAELPTDTGIVWQYLDKDVKLPRDLKAKPPRKFSTKGGWLDDPKMTLTAGEHDFETPKGEPEAPDGSHPDENIADWLRDNRFPAQLEKVLKKNGADTTHDLHGIDASRLLRLKVKKSTVYGNMPLLQRNKFWLAIAKLDGRNEPAFDLEEDLDLNLPGDTEEGKNRRRGGIIGGLVMGAAGAAVAMSAVGAVAVGAAGAAGAAGAVGVATATATATASAAAAGTAAAFAAGVAAGALARGLSGNSRAKAEAEAERIKAEADAEAERVKREANAEAERVRKQAEEKSQEEQDEAAAEAERLQLAAEAEIERLRQEANDEAKRVSESSEDDEDETVRKKREEAKQAMQDALEQEEHAKALADEANNVTNATGNPETDERVTLAGHSGGKMSRFMGVYVKQATDVHEYPHYVREFGDTADPSKRHRYCLYRASYNGKWIVTSKESDMAMNKGSITSKESAKRPTDTGIMWQYLDPAAKPPEGIEGSTESAGSVVWLDDPKMTLTVTAGGDASTADGKAAEGEVAAAARAEAAEVLRLAKEANEEAERYAAGFEAAKRLEAEADAKRMVAEADETAKEKAAEAEAAAKAKADAEEHAEMQKDDTATLVGFLHANGLNPALERILHVLGAEETADIHGVDLQPNARKLIMKSKEYVDLLSTTDHHPISTLQPPPSTHQL